MSPAPLSHVEFLIFHTDFVTNSTCHQEEMTTVILCEQLVFSGDIVLLRAFS
jgi:hypothetical protein